MKRLAFCSFFIRSISEGWLFVLLTTAQACGALACCHCVARTTCSRGWQNARRAQSCHRGRPSYLQATGQPRAAGSKTLQAPAASTGLAQGRQARWLWLRRVCCEAAAPQVYTTPQCSPAVHRLAETARVTLSLLRWRRQSTSLPESFLSNPSRSGLRATKSAVPLSLFPPKLPRRQQRGVPSCHCCASTRFTFLSACAAPIRGPQQTQEHGAGSATRCRLAPLRPPGQAALTAAPAQ